MIERPQTISDLVLDQLEKDILDKKYKPGDRIVEGEIAKRLGVSRGPVREALLILERRGFITEKKQGSRGRRVVSFNKQKISNCYQLRAFLESQCLLHIGMNQDREALERLRESSEQMRVMLENGDLEGYRKADVSFHRLIVFTVGNDRIYEIYLENDRMLRWLGGVTLPSQRMAQSFGEHQQMLDYCEKGDIVALMKLMNHHQLQALGTIFSRYDKTNGQ